LASGLPREAKPWLEQFLEAGSNTIALVYLYGVSGAPNPQAEAAQEYLAEVARRVQVEFFAQAYLTVTPAPVTRSVELVTTVVA